MTQDRLRELLHERVADVTMPDRSASAWQAGRGARRRARVGVVAGVAAAALGASAVLAVVESTPSDPRPTPVAPSIEETQQPDATYQGVPVWWSPDQVEERVLPTIGSRLPEEIDLAGSIDVPPQPLQEVVAAFAQGRSVRLIGAVGLSTWVDLSRLDDVTKPNGYSYFPTGRTMLSPSGRHLAFPQDGGHIAVYTPATTSWSDIDTGGAPSLDLIWLDGDTIYVPAGPGRPGRAFAVDGTSVESEPPGEPEPGLDTAQAQAYGPPRWYDAGTGARSWGRGVPLPVRDPPRDLSGPEFLGVNTDGRPLVLAIMDAATDGQDSRFKDCCPVAGWLDERTVVYESRQSEPLLVAWRVGSGEFRLVSRITGDYDVASFATL